MTIEPQIQFDVRKKKLVIKNKNKNNLPSTREMEYEWVSEWSSKLLRSKRLTILKLLLCRSIHVNFNI